MGCGASSARPAPVAEALVPMGNRPNVDSFRQLDERVLLTPSEVTESVHSLAEHLDSICTTELEKIRAVYKWITRNLEFDPSMTILNDNKSQLSVSDADFALTSRQVGRDGFSIVAYCLFKLLGVDCMLLTGHAKDFGYSPLQPLTLSSQPNHDWFAVRADGKWGFVDCVLGTGCCSESGAFERRETDFYFLPAPETFLNDHFPLLNFNLEASIPWQLMEKPIDLDTFHARVRRREASYRLGVRPTSHARALVNTSASGLVKLKFRSIRQPLSQFSACFFNPDTGEKCRSSLAASVLDWRNQEATIYARVPTRGAFWELRVRAATEQSAGEAEWLASFFLQSTAQVDEQPFPEFDGFYGAKVSPHSCGFRKEFGSDSGFRIDAEGGELSLRFPIYMPVRASAALQFAKSLEKQISSCMLEMDYLMLTVRLRMSRVGFYRLTLSCKDIYSVSSEYPEFANFLIYCSKPLAKLVAFPRTWHHRHQVKLVSHTEEAIQVNSEAVLKFKGLGPRLKLLIARFVHPRTGQRISGPYIAAVLDHRTNEATVTARPPTSGAFWELQVFASTDEERQSSDVIASYQILAQHTSTDSPLPEFNGFYGVCGSPQKCGFAADDLGAARGFRLKTSVGEFELKLPTVRAIRAMAVLKPAKERPGQQQQQQQQKQLCKTDSSSRLLTVTVRIWQAGFYRLTLSCAESDEPNSFADLANFLVDCSAESGPAAQWLGRQPEQSYLRWSDSDSGVSRD